MGYVNKGCSPLGTAEPARLFQPKELPKLMFSSNEILFLIDWKCLSRESIKDTLVIICSERPQVNSVFGIANIETTGLQMQFISCFTCWNGWERNTAHATSSISCCDGPCPRFWNVLSQARITWFHTACLAQHEACTGCWRFHVRIGWTLHTFTLILRCLDGSLQILDFFSFFYLNYEIMWT